MNYRQAARLTSKWFAVGIGVASTAYVGATWFRYGRPKIASENSDELLDTFMPAYDVVDRHAVRVGAPGHITLSAAANMDLEECRVVRGIFRARELILRSKPDEAARPRGIIAATTSLGWGLLAEVPDREIVMGAVTKPWEPNPVFRSLPPAEFATFEEPGYVKIVWTLRADPESKDESVFSTETRAIATDPKARKRFRWYWSFLSPGIRIIRRAMLPVVKTEAERHWRELAA